mmetsp:Transcript_1128/g.2498  ORF Transcript_1128/g.2498 Transcript_1128/m.2498 type:complete len:200 (+) Transcript_1128:624-1223(+)
MIPCISMVIVIIDVDIFFLLSISVSGGISRRNVTCEAKYRIDNTDNNIIIFLVRAGTAVILIIVVLMLFHLVSEHDSLLWYYMDFGFGWWSRRRRCCRSTCLVETRTRAFHQRHHGQHLICGDVTWCDRIDRSVLVESILPSSLLRGNVLAGVILFQREDGTHGGCVSCLLFAVTGAGAVPGLVPCCGDCSSILRCSVL